MPGLAALAVMVQFVNDRSPTVTVDTLTDSGQATVSADTAPGTFVAHISASDPNRGANGHVTCLMDSYGDDFRLVRMFDGEYKLLTERSFDIVGVIVVSVLCRDHGDPPLSTQTNISVTVNPAYSANNPVFTQRAYNASLSLKSHAPAFVIRVAAAAQPNSSSDSGVWYSFAQTYPAFSIERTTGVVRMLVSPFESTTAELVVVATAVGGRSSRAKVYVSLVPPEQVLFSSTVACRVREDAAPGTSICSLADTDSDGYLYHDLVDAAGGTFRADPISGIVYTNRTLDRELTPHFRLAARVQLDRISTRVVDVLVDVEVEDVNDCPPLFIFPSPGNETVFVDAATSRLSTSGTLHVAVVIARDQDASQNGRVSYSIVANNSDSRYFVMAPSTGEVRLNVVDRLDNIINRTFVLYIAAADHGRPSLQSVAVLYIVVPAEIPTSSQHFELRSDSRLMHVLAGVLASFFIVAIVIGVAILIVCCRSKQQKPQQSITGDLLWGRVQSDSSVGSRTTLSAPTISPNPTTNDVDRTFHLNTLIVDAGIDPYFQRYNVSTTS